MQNIKKQITCSFGRSHHKALNSLPLVAGTQKQNHVSRIIAQHLRPSASLYIYLMFSLRKGILLLGLCCLTACSSVPKSPNYCYSGVVSEELGNSVTICASEADRGQAIIVMNFSNRTVPNSTPARCTQQAIIRLEKDHIVVKGKGGRCNNGRELAKINYKCDGFKTQHIACENMTFGGKYNFELHE